MPKRKAGTSVGPAPANRGKKQSAQALQGGKKQSAQALQGASVEDASTLLTKHGLSLPSDWLGVMAPEISKPYFTELLTFVQGERKKHKVYPDSRNVMGAFNLCPFSSVRVVIIGQDPYHGPGQGHGPAFSVQGGIDIPPSLRNIFKEAVDDVQISKPKHGHLGAWAKQGILLLNTVLTVRHKHANSHAKRGWELFTQVVIDEIASRKEGVVFLAWGGQALERVQGVSTKKHHILNSSHPSPLGAWKTATPFIGSRCFSRTNHLLEANGSVSINWAIPKLKDEESGATMKKGATKKSLARGTTLAAKTKGGTGKPCTGTCGS
jgi:uracil-DNA glycosylase